MKTMISLTSLFLVLAISTQQLISVASESAPEAVIDIRGNQLRSGVDYYILPVVRGRGGGLTLGATRNKSCPLDVVQHRFEVSNGLPLRFTPVNPKKGVIRLSTDLNIKFSAATTCVQSTVWKLDRYDETSGQWFVTTGGAEGNPGRETISNWFKIEKYQDDYKLVFCPTVCNYCKVLCRDVAIYYGNGTRSLALGVDPFRVMFKKA